MPSTDSEFVQPFDSGGDPHDLHDPNLAALIDQISQEPEIDIRLRDRLIAVRELLVEPPDASRPFLSVILRTQGTRVEPFKDAMLCLQAQTDQDFEVVVVAHDADDDALRSVQRTLQRQPIAFRGRIRVERVTGGSRSRPLNAGVRSAKGRYIAVFDDDDLLFADWVEVFHRAADANRGRLVRTVVANQSVEAEVWPTGEAGFRTKSWPTPEYAARFDQLQHLLVNHSPFMSWAFPRELFELYGLRFDEELLATEDWDLILRGALLCGVDDEPALTAIYRRWDTAGSSSYTIHTRDEWMESERRVIDRLDRSVIMMPPGTTMAVRRMVLYNNALDAYRFMFSGHRLRWPLNRLWEFAAPVAHLAVRVRNRIRRARR